MVSFRVGFRQGFVKGLTIISYLGFTLVVLVWNSLGLVSGFSDLV